MHIPPPASSLKQSQSLTCTRLLQPHSHSLPLTDTVSFFLTEPLSPCPPTLPGITGQHQQKRGSKAHLTPPPCPAPAMVRSQTHCHTRSATSHLLLQPTCPQVAQGAFLFYMQTNFKLLIATRSTKTIMLSFISFALPIFLPEFFYITDVKVFIDGSVHRPPATAGPAKAP